MNDETNKQTLADLEAQVRQELGITAPMSTPTATPVAVPQNTDLQGKMSYLEALKTKIDTKITAMENEVKIQLEEVKKTKALIEKEIGKIKHLEETRDLIDVDIKKIQTLEETKHSLETEIASLEKNMEGTI